MQSVSYLLVEALTVGNIIKSIATGAMSSPSGSFKIFHPNGLATGKDAKPASTDAGKKLASVPSGSQASESKGLQEKTMFNDGKKLQ